ncbi:SDR family oxidoreductase [Solicola gregarius]|uniref:SDR family NAD(P)-dependent oxidoreductase n=1 Tax=Solicola gregarius TaxID=2908642 RepID=A0AA46TIQ2_9ACTN|nr:SDR family NAD(P)-dependent oxidoreductase [Solicola gregarius]UYM05870.1 SDR family NAD(P)-dependent oxidoreductase [Solicola gregarius]
MNTNNSTVLLTGATNETGIGIGLARRLTDRGSTVIVSGRNRERLFGVAAEHPDFDTLHLDVDSPQSIAEAVASLKSTHPNLNGLITLAGVMVPEDVFDPRSVSIAEEIVHSNLIGTIRSVRAFLPQLLDQPEATIITVASGLGFVPRLDVPSYSASKAGVRMYTDAIRRQLANTNVDVKLLAPPAVRTSLMHQENMVGAVPRDDFADEILAILDNEPDNDELIAEAVKPLRYAEANGKYQEMMDMLAGDVQR